MKQQLLISISISLAIHILILCLLKLSVTGSNFSEANANNIALSVQLKQTNVPNINSEITSGSSDANKSDINQVEDVPDNATPQVDPLDHTAFFNPEPKYYSLKELDHRPVMVSEIDTRPSQLAQYNQGGEIKIQIWIDEDGNVVKSQVVNSTLPQAFIDYTIASFSQAKFNAGIKDGVPVRSVAKVVVQYAATDQVRE